MEINQNLNPEMMEKIIKDRKVRTTLVKKSHLLFFTIYFSHYIKYPLAPFHREMFALSEDSTPRVIAIMAFRGSGKSTIMNLSYTLWSILGIQQKKCVVIISKTEKLARMHFLNLQQELERNDLLRKDLGPFRIDDVADGALSLFFPQMEARIFIASNRQSIRGMHHGSHRPELVILDDIEDTINQPEDKEGVYKWFNEEILPLGDESTHIVVLGNLITRDCLLMRIREDVDQERFRGIFVAYPIMDNFETPLWPTKFPSEEIEKIRKRIPDIKIWEREYLLFMNNHANDNHNADPEVDRWFQCFKVPIETPNPHPNPQTMADYTITRPMIRDEIYCHEELSKILDEVRKSDDPLVNPASGDLSKEVK